VNFRNKYIIKMYSFAWRRHRSVSIGYGLDDLGLIPKGEGIFFAAATRLAVDLPFTASYSVGREIFHRN